VRAADTETCLIQRALKTPPLVVVSWATPQLDAGLVHWKDGEDFCASLLEEPSIWFNAPFDLAVIGEQYSRLWSKIFDALGTDGLIYDVMIRMRMLDIAYGRLASPSKPVKYKGADGERYKVFYDLSTTHHRLCGSFLEKDKWRLRYGEFRDIPISEWPEGAKEYPKQDAIATMRAFLAQEKIEDSEEIFEDQFRQYRAHMALHLISCWGIRTDVKAIRKLDRRLKAEWEEAREKLMDAGLIRSEGARAGTRDLKLAKAMMWEALGEDCHITEKGEQIWKYLVKKKKARPKDAKLLVLHMEDRKYISTNAESCRLAAEAGHPVLKDYYTYVHIEKLRKTYVSAYWDGVKFPIQTRFTSILETGRTSSSQPNIQNLPREEGLREVFVPRPGCVFVAVDYDLAELRSLAQVCITLFKHSNLADALNAGLDPHLDLASQLMGISYVEAQKRKNYGGNDPHWLTLQKEVKQYRTLAKAANFGFPGGLGAKSFIAFAKGAYGVDLSLDQARRLKFDWKTKWPEMESYFDHIGSMFPRRDFDKDYEDETEEERKLRFIKIQQLYSHRCRGRVSFTQACNTQFQGLTADAAKEALWEITREQFTMPKSVLYSTHLVNFVHDENILEVEEWRGHEAAYRMRDIMVEVYNRWTPDVPMTAEPTMMRRWSKIASDKPVFNKEGRLIPWEDRSWAA